MTSDPEELCRRIWACERALSLTQPWGWCIVSMPGRWKNIENRTKGFSYKSFRGDFFVHATKVCSALDYQSCREWMWSRFGAGAFSTVPARQDLELGGIIGMVRVVDLLQPGDTPRAEWHMPEQYGFVLEERVELPFVACGGKQGFWRVGRELQERIVRAVKGPSE